MVLVLTLVVDSNILFAAAIKEGSNARLLLSDRLRLIAPERLFEEFTKYRELLLSKTHRSSEEFEKFLEILEEKIEVLPKVEFEFWLE
jgi:predicted nucleic acid-binding protein